MESTDGESLWSGARCAGLAASNPSKYDRVFFPTKGRPTKNPEYKEICNGCPIVAFCLSYALVYDEEGNWGGMTKIQRDRLLKTNPTLKKNLIAEARLQGWYSERQSIDQQIQVLRKKQASLEIQELVVQEFEFDFEVVLEPEHLQNLDMEFPVLHVQVRQSSQIESGYVSQTQLISLPPLAELLGEAPPQIALPKTYSDQRKFRFDFEAL